MSKRFSVAAHRTSSRVTSRLFVAALCAVAACSKDDGSVTISGDVAGLDSIGLRGDALIANAGKLPSEIDSLRAVADGKVTRPHTPGSKSAANSAANTASVSTPSLPGVNPMTARAQARGDSMAKAAAMRLVNGSAAGGSRGDTMRGVVTVLGPEAAKQVVLKVPSGNTISLSGMATTGLARLAGTEIVVRGVKISPRDVVVSDYLVRASNGAPAFDGKLEGGSDTGWWLQLTDGTGRKRLASLPSPLHGLEGTRVWIAYKAGNGGIDSYGIVGRR